MIAGQTIEAVVFDVGRVLYQWDLRHLFRKLIADEAELEAFVTDIVSPEWHFQHDAGRPAADMVAERSAEFPQHAALIEAYAARFNETIPGPVDGSIELVERLYAARRPALRDHQFRRRLLGRIPPDCAGLRLF